EDSRLDRGDADVEGSGDLVVGHSACGEQQQRMPVASGDVTQALADLTERQNVLHLDINSGPRVSPGLVQRSGWLFTPALIAIQVARDGQQVRADRRLS